MHRLYLVVLLVCHFCCCYAVNWSGGAYWDKDSKDQGRCVVRPFLQAQQLNPVDVLRRIPAFYLLRAFSSTLSCSYDQTVDLFQRAGSGDGHSFYLEDFQKICRAFQGGVAGYDTAVLKNMVDVQNWFPVMVAVSREKFEKIQEQLAFHQTTAPYLLIFGSPTGLFPVVSKLARLFQDETGLFFPLPSPT